MRTFAWQGTRPVFSEREISNTSPYILGTEDGAWIAFSRDRHCTQPYSLAIRQEDAHRFATFERAFSVLLELKSRYGETVSIHSL